MRIPNVQCVQMDLVIGSVLNVKSIYVMIAKGIQIKIAPLTTCSRICHWRRKILIDNIRYEAIDWMIKGGYGWEDIVDFDFLDNTGVMHSFCDELLGVKHHLIPVII